MSRPSTKQLQDFIQTAEFESFVRALVSEWCISTSRAAALWPDAGFASHRDRLRWVAERLKEVVRRNLLDFRDPDYLGIDSKVVGYFSPIHCARVVALLPEGLIGCEPVCVHQGDWKEGEPEFVAERLRGRVPAIATVQPTTVYFDFRYRIQGDCHFPSVFDWPFARNFYENFACGAFDFFHERFLTSEVVKLPRHELMQLLANRDFLESPNMLLFLSEIRQRIRDAQDWTIHGRSCTYTNLDGERRTVIFGGTLSAHRLREERGVVEIW